MAKASKPAAAVKNQTAQAKITWPEMEYKLPSPSAHLISKSAQNNVFGSLIEGATNNAMALFLFECAFPEKTYKSCLLRDVLVMAVQELNQTAIAKRIQHPSQKECRTPLQDYMHILLAVNMPWLLISCLLYST
ncbi:hypothetical protein V5O48_011571 [Marasmius crinis-equi]|uniref:Uncharacterized protein n=1 Tax=Marasmius crinis-equi TaxID=585013 RepID=A0ABR3F556_9AGAR